MSIMSGRRRLLFVSLGLSIVIWGADALRTDETPREAGAVTTSASAQSPQDQLATSDDVTRLIAALSGNATLDSGVPPSGLTRNLFAVTALIKAAIAPENVRQADEESETTADKEIRERPFDERHTLHAVVAGRVPLALVDRLVVSKGAIIDGYELVAIHRDHVVLRQDDSLVRLWIASSANPGSHAPSEPRP